MNEEVRWRYRFRNFSRAYALLSEALEQEIGELQELEREGAVRRFEYTFQLAWLTLKDRLEYGGIVVFDVTSRNVIREAYAAKLIDDAEVWIDILVDRNLVSHTYDFARFKATLENVRNRYLAVLGNLYERLGLETLGCRAIPIYLQPPGRK